MVIPESIRKRLEQLEVYLAHLEEMRKISKVDFIKDWKAQDIVVRNFQIAVEACTDIGANIISRKGLNVPESYVGIIESLAENNIIPKDFSEKFKELAKFRNIIVHEYLDIDYEEVYKSLQRIDELREYIKYVVEYLEKSK